MKIDVQRLAKLAGLSNERNGLLREGVSHDQEVQEKYDMEEGEASLTRSDEAAAEDPDEMIDVDEKMLVQELRRAKAMLAESRKRKQATRANLQEAELKRIVESEVQSVLKDLNLSSGWYYGNKKPSRSRRGYTHQGSYLKGIGFK